MHFQQASDTLALAGADVQHAVAALELAGIDANECQLADERVGHDLEGQGGKGLLVVGLAGLFFVSVGIRSHDVRNVKRRGQKINHGIEQRLHAFVLERGAADDREYLQRNGALAQRGFQLVGGNAFAFQEFVQDGVVVFRDGLD